ncbi:MAG: hypothetical protein JJV98_13990 [Desulfosarcina sp.]|nr:hypothetical protein [Desulfobacterales bacterium]
MVEALDVPGMDLSHPVLGLGHVLAGTLDHYYVSMVREPINSALLKIMEG